MQLAALTVDIATQCLEASVQRLAHRPWHCQILNHVGQDLEVVESAQDFLNALDLAHAALRSRFPSVPGQLEPVAQLLCRDTNAVDAIGDIECSRVGDGFPDPLRTALQADGEHLGPRVGLLTHRQDTRDISEVPFQLARVHRRELVQHSFAALVSLVGQVMLQPLAGLGFDPLFPDELGDDTDRHIDLPHATQRTSDTPQTPAGAIGQPPWHLASAQRQNLAESPRGHASLVERLHLAHHGERQMLAERPGQPLEGPRQWL